MPEFTPKPSFFGFMKGNTLVQFNGPKPTQAVTGTRIAVNMVGEPAGKIEPDPAYSQNDDGKQWVARLDLSTPDNPNLTTISNNADWICGTRGAATGDKPLVMMEVGPGKNKIICTKVNAETGVQEDQWSLSIEGVADASQPPDHVPGQPDADGWTAISDVDPRIHGEAIIGGVFFTYESTDGKGLVQDRFGDWFYLPAV